MLDFTGVLFFAALILTWIGAKGHWAYRFMAAVVWLALAAYWLAGNQPVTIVAGTPVDQILVIFYIGMGLVCLGMVFYSYGENGNPGVFKLPWLPSLKDEREERSAPDLSLIHISEPTRLGMISYA